MRRSRSRSRSRRPTGRRGPRPRNHRRSPLPRHGPASRTSRPTSTSPRRLTHPIYERSTMSRRHSPPTRAPRHRPHSGGTRTIRTTTGNDSQRNVGRHHSRQGHDSPNSFRLCSKPREHRDTHRHQRGLFDREPGVHIQAKARPTRPVSKSRSPQPEPEPPHTLDESLEMKIPPSVDIPPVDWSQLTPELLEQGQGEEQPLPRERPTWMDWTTMVKQAYEDPSRTRAACELVHAGIICLAQKVRTEKFETFLRILHTRNPNTPQMILGNMASIFAYSGKVTRTQAGGSYAFKVSGSFGFGLVVPTFFRQKPGFRDDSSKVYHLIHGTTSQGASRILAEDLIRPGDFSMRQDHLLQSDFPTYGHCSMGRQAADTTLSPLQVKHLTKTTLRTTQGSMAASVYGIYTGLHPHQNHRVDSNDKAQVLCGKYGIARGLHNTLVARSEHTTVSAVILTYQHKVETRAPTTRSTSIPSVKSSSNLS